MCNPLRNRIHEKRLTIGDRTQLSILAESMDRQYIDLKPWEDAMWFCIKCGHKNWFRVWLHYGYMCIVTPRIYTCGKCDQCVMAYRKTSKPIYYYVSDEFRRGWDPLCYISDYDPLTWYTMIEDQQMKIWPETESNGMLTCVT